jgi:serine/threonine protein kinase
VFDVAAIDRYQVIAMDPLDAETMAAWLQRRRRSARAIVRVIAAAADGLAAAHAAGLAHGAIQPDHILIGKDGRVVLTGFGVGHAPRGPTAYMAPERLGGLLGPSADQFALCATLWEALAGRPPFPGSTAEELARAAHAGAPDPRGIPRGLRGPLQRGLSFAAAARWPSVEALMRGLRGGLRTRAAVGAIAAIASIAAATLAVLVAVHALHDSPRDRMRAKLKEATDQMCACATAGPQAASCAQEVTRELSKWAAELGDRDDSPPGPPTAEEAKLAQRLTECATQALTAGVQQQP